MNMQLQITGEIANKNKTLLYAVDTSIAHAINLGDDLILKIDENINKQKNNGNK